jgi:hypothetical protein
MEHVDKYLSELRRVFSRSGDKHEANFRSRELLVEMSGDKVFFSDVLRRHLRKRDSLNTRHYPVVGLDIELNEYFGLVANCWIPLPGRESNIASKSIHHHGSMLLTTVTAFGPGYEHWMFETPSVVDAESEIYELKLLERSPHPLHHVAFVDAYIAHLPLYPPDTTITYALWSSRAKTSWRDKLKRIPLLQDNSERLRAIGNRIGLRNLLELKVIEYYDFYPCGQGFRGMRERKEFQRSNNEDYLASLFHVIQKTENDQLVPEIREILESGERIENRELVNRYLGDLESGKPIEGKLSEQHFGFDYANFTSDQILQAIDIQSHKQSAGN